MRTHSLDLILYIVLAVIASCSDHRETPDTDASSYTSTAEEDSLLDVFGRMQRVHVARFETTPFQNSDRTRHPFMIESDSNVYDLYRSLKRTTGFSRIRSAILNDSSYISKRYGSVIALLRSEDPFRGQGNPLAAALYYNDTSGRLYCCNLATDSLSVIDVDDGLVSLGRRFASQRPASYEEIGAEPTPHSIVCVMTRSYSYSIAVCFQFPYAVIDYKTDFGMRDLMSQDQFDRRKLVDTLIYSLFGACNSGATPY